MRERYSKSKRTGAVAALAGTFFAFGYLGFMKDHDDPALAPSSRQKAYEARVAPMSVRERYLAEFIVGMTVCNPDDKNNFIANLGIITGPESCGVLASEADERLGRTCLQGTSYDTSDENAELLPTPNGGQVTIRSPAPNQYELHFRFTPDGVFADDRTALILHDYGCEDIRHP